MMTPWMKLRNLIQSILELQIDGHWKKAGRFTNRGEGNSSGFSTDRSGLISI